MPEKCLKIEKCPKNVQKSVNYGNFLTIVIKLVKMYLFCDKTFVIRPTSNPKKLKLTKIGQKLEENRQYTPLWPFWEVQPKFFLQYASLLQYEHF